MSEENNFYPAIRERKVGSIVPFEGRSILVAAGTCMNCVFLDPDADEDSADRCLIEPDQRDYLGECCWINRSDNRSVCFTVLSENGHEKEK